MPRLLLLLLAGQGHATFCDPVPFTAAKTCDSASNPGKKYHGDGWTQAECAWLCSKAGSAYRCCRWHETEQECWSEKATQTKYSTGANWHATMLPEWESGCTHAACLQDCTAVPEHSEFAVKRTCDQDTRNGINPGVINYGKTEDGTDDGQRWTQEKCVRKCSEAGSDYRCCRWHEGGECVAQAATRTKVSEGGSWHATMLDPRMYQCGAMPIRTTCSAGSSFRIGGDRQPEPRKYHSRRKCVEACEAVSAGDPDYSCCKWNLGSKSCVVSVATDTMVSTGRNWYGTTLCHGESRHARALKTVVGTVQHQLVISNSTNNKSIVGNTTTQ